MTLPQALLQAAAAGRLLVAWAAPGFPLADSSPANRATAMNRLPAVPALAGEWQAALPALPPLPILSLDPTDRLERAFAAAGVPLHVVSTEQDVPVPARHNLLKLAGDLPTRHGVVLSRAEVRDLHANASRRYLLDEARRIAEGGALLLLGADPGRDDFHAWWAALAPALGGVPWFAVGDPAAPWPDGVTCLGAGVQAVAAALRAAPAPPTAAAPGYDLAAVRDLLLAAFTTDDLRRLVLYTSQPVLRPLSHEFSPGDGLAAMVEKTVTFCTTHDCFVEMLAEVEAANPRRYAQFSVRRQAE